VTESTLVKPKSKSKVKTRGRYLYCLIRAEDAIPEFEIAPVPASLEESNGRVYTVVAGKVAAVVSNSPIMRYPVSRGNLLAHERVLEHVMEQMPALPVKYGTVASSQEDLISKLLVPREAELVGLLNNFDGRVEVSLKAFWQRERIFAEVAQQPEIARLRDKIMSRPDNQNHLDKIELGQMIERALESTREADAERLLARLRPLALEVKQNPITLDMLVLNSAFLIEADKQAAFDEAVNALDEEMSLRLTLKYAGPLPPFNFLQLNLATVEE